MKDNYLFHRICKECDRFQNRVTGGWWTYPVPRALSGVYINIMGADDDCYDGIYITSVRQARVFLKGCERFLK